MPHSMTAFARRERPCEWGVLTWELRSINHRYLEPQLRLPEGVRQLEPELRERLKKCLARGKLDCSLQLRYDADKTGFAVDTNLLQGLDEALQRVAANTSAQAPASTLELLRWPGVLREQGPDAHQLESAILLEFDLALEALLEGRAREGAELAALMRQRVDAIEALVAELQQQLPTLRAAQRQRLLDRLAEIDVEVDAQRLEQELVYLAQRADIDEELDRLLTHLAEVRRVLEAAGPCGRRLDFLMQELNREANTLGSKAGAKTTSQIAIDIKVLIEQMREQVQNIE